VDDVKAPRRATIINDFVGTKPRLNISVAKQLDPMMAGLGHAVMLSQTSRPQTIEVDFSQSEKLSSSARTLKDQALNIFQKNTIAFYAVLIIAVALVGAPIISNYISSSIKLSDNPGALPLSTKDLEVSGLNTAVPNSQLASSVAAIISQPARLNLGSQSVAINPSIINSWLEITPNATRTQDNIHINPLQVGSSLLSLAKQYEKTPINQVTITRSDGSSEVAIAGQNGSQLQQPITIADQAVDLSKSLMSNKGFQVNAPLSSLPYQAVTPVAYPKLIVVDLNSKRMYVYQNGQLINTFLTSDGKPTTPTPVGEFHIWDKLASQTMTGPGYVQPNVPWVNYFDHSGDAIHGVYWRPASIFGNVNTSHGCVGVPVNVGEWIFNWAPIGTPVITTPN
jgi:lipoprotein-anchoring transpeptidase ErfK/SrfK